MLFFQWLFLPIFAQVPINPAPEAYIWTELAKQGIVVLLMGTIIVYLKKKLELREAEIKTLYELQSKEYMASLNIMAAAAESNNKLKAILEEQPDSLKIMVKNQKEIRAIVEEIGEQLNRQRDHQ